MENPAPSAAPLPQPLSLSDERTWALLAHLSILINLFTGVLGPVAALVIYLVYKDRSRYVAYQAMQSFIFQLIVIFEDCVAAFGKVLQAFCDTVDKILFIPR